MSAEFGIRNSELMAASSAQRAFSTAHRAIADAPGSAAHRPVARNANDRKKVGEFVGNVFYGTLIKQMQASKLKGPVMHGGRGEEVFGGQLGMELAKRMGQSANNPLADRIYHAILKHSGKLNSQPAATVNTKERA